MPTLRLWLLRKQTKKLVHKTHFAVQFSNSPDTLRFNQGHRCSYENGKLSGGYCHADSEISHWNTDTTPPPKVKGTAKINYFLSQAKVTRGIFYVTLPMDKTTVQSRTGRKNFPTKTAVLPYLHSNDHQMRSVSLKLVWNCSEAYHNTKSKNLTYVISD